MLEFTPVSKENLNIISKAYKNSRFKISDYSVCIKYMWKDITYPEYTISSGYLIVKENYDGICRFDFPIEIEEGADIFSALNQIEEYCKENFIPLEFDYIPRECLSLFAERYERTEQSVFNNLSDYLYLREDLASFSGRKYSGQRNHIKKFKNTFPSASFRILNEEDIPLVKHFFEEFKASFENASEGALDELLRAEKMSDFVGSDLFICGGYELEGKLISFCLYEICGNMAINHIEKAFPQYEGLYPATVNAFAMALPLDVCYINREDDAGIRGLRISKLQYQPCELVKKYSLKIKNELSEIGTQPRLFTNRLVLDKIEEWDAKKYFNLSTDEKINSFWGYDYRDSYTSPEINFFYEDQKSDFENRMALNLAIRYKGKFAGEVILYNFDYRSSSCEAGVRIFCEFDGKGIGNEAFTAVCNYALYTLGLSSVRAKCYKENLASGKMLSKSMKKEGEDEYFFYFVRNV